MALRMSRAFNSRMLTTIIKRSIGEGSYDSTNEWISATPIESNIRGIITSGNKFSQFDEGISIHNEVGGIRTSDYKQLYLSDKYTLDINDQVGFNGIFYNILQQSDETIHGFNEFLIEKSK